MGNGLAVVLTPLEKRSRMVGAWMVSQVFAHVDFSDTNFETARCEKAAFVAVDLRGADFRGAVLTNALFLRCDLAGARFPDARLDRARFVACTGLDPEVVRVLCDRGAQVSEAAVPGVRGPVSATMRRPVRRQGRAANSEGTGRVSRS